MEKLLLRPDEAAMAIGVGRSKLYALIAAGKVPAIRVGNVLRVPLDDLRQWIEGQAKGQRPTP